MTQHNETEPEETVQMRILDLFCGAGGMSTGMENVGGDIVMGVDDDKPSVEAFNSNHEAVAVQEDLSRISPMDFSKKYDLEPDNIDCVIGGPPCQGFSNANNERDISDYRNNLVFVFLEYVDFYQPDWFLMENVSGMLSIDDGDIVEELTRGFEDSGYTVDSKKINSVNYGVPQKRKRLFFLGSLYGDVVWPDDEPSAGYKTVRDSIFDLPHLKSGEKSDVRHHNATNHKEDTVEALDELEVGERLYDSWQDSWRRLPWDEPSWTVTSRNKAVFVHPSQPRLLTERECARLQTIPDTFDLCGNKDDRFQQVANATPPKMISELGEVMLKDSDC